MTLVKKQIKDAVKTRTTTRSKTKEGAEAYQRLADSAQVAIGKQPNQFLVTGSERAWLPPMSNAELFIEHAWQIREARKYVAEHQREEFYDYLHDRLWPQLERFDQSLITDEMRERAEKADTDPVLFAFRSKMAFHIQHLYMDWLRRAATKTVDIDIENLIASECIDPESAAIASDLLRRLPEMTMAAAVMQVAGYTEMEIAQKLHTSRRDVRNRLETARHFIDQ